MKTIFFSIFTISALLFVSCSSDNDTTPTNGLVKFTSGINSATTKVGGVDGDEWDAGDKIGIFMCDNAAGKAIVSNNVEYTVDILSNSNKSATFTSSSSIYYPTSTPTKVNFLAYHPYATLTNNYLYDVDVATQTSQSAIDLMYASNDNSTAGFDKSNTLSVNLRFYHQLAKVKFIVSAGNGVANLTGLTANIKGMNTTAQFDVASGQFISTGSIAAIIPFDAGSNNYEAILLPVILGTNQVMVFTVGGNTYNWTISNNDNSITKLESGKLYTFYVTIEKNQVVVTSCTIQPWGNGSTANGTAN